MNTFYILSPINMKKLLLAILTWALGIVLSIGSASAASSDCLNLKFINWDSICLGISKNGSNITINVEKNNLEKNSTIKCNVVLPNTSIRTLDGCKGSFSYGWNGSDVIVSALYITKNDDFYSKRVPAEINFSKWTWGSSSSVISSSSSSSSNSDEVQLSTNRKSPSTSQYVNLTIKTDRNYTGKLYLSAKYRKSSSDSWSSISNTSSSYFNNYSSEWSNEYYRMTSSDRGEVTLSNLVKFRKDGYYRIYVKDTDGNESYIQYSVGDTDNDDDSDVSWFSSTELDKVKKIYKEWNSMIAQMQRQYPVLKNNSTWTRLSENFYDDMKDVVDKKKTRDFDDYEDFQNAFDDWYKYTMQNI